MRFKARTDLERIYDIVNSYSFGRAPKWIIKRQLKDLDLNFATKPRKKMNSEERESIIQNGDYDEFVEAKETERVVDKK